MQRPPPNAALADTVLDSDRLTGYDEQHLVTYVRLLYAEADGARWAEIARLLLHIDPAQEP